MREEDVRDGLKAIRIRLMEAGVSEAVARSAVTDAGKIGAQFAEDWYVEKGWVIPTPRRPISRELRDMVFEAFGEQCTYCLGEEGPFEIDHLTPLARGGTDAFENLAVACRPCNRKKRAMPYEDWLEIIAKWPGKREHFLLQQQARARLEK